MGDELDGQLLDAVVRALFGLSWGRARDLVGRGKVLVGERTVTSGTVRVRAGTTLTIDPAARDPQRVKTALEDAAIVFLDAHVVVVNKPAGVSTIPFDAGGMGASLARRPRSPNDEVTLDQRVRTALAKRERARGHRGPPPDVGVVHRLDKETSGLIVFTRTWTAKRALAQAFRVHTVHRRYLAIVHGIPEDQTIVSHLVEDRGDGIRGSVEHRRGRKKAVGDERTQRAVTHVEVLERFEGGGAGQPAALVACRLETGRTHQIRIHLAEVGHPLLGERVYIRGRELTPIPAPRIMLHAAELGFVHPAEEEEDAERRSWTAPLPEDMTEMLQFLRGIAGDRATNPA